MEEITQQLQELIKSRKIPKLLYEQTNQKKVDLIVNDFPVE